jgi:hypothetical protein
MVGSDEMRKTFRHVSAFHFFCESIKDCMLRVCAGFWMFLLRKGDRADSTREYIC